MSFSEKEIRDVVQILYWIVGFALIFYFDKNKSNNDTKFWVSLIVLSVASFSNGAHDAMMNRVPGSSDLLWHVLKWNFFYGMGGAILLLGFDEWLSPFFRSRLFAAVLSYSLWEVGYNVAAS